jgi:hypothetical protein
VGMGFWKRLKNSDTCRPNKWWYMRIYNLIDIIRKFLNDPIHSSNNKQILAATLSDDEVNFLSQITSEVVVSDDINTMVNLIEKTKDTINKEEQSFLEKILFSCI